MPTLWSDLCAQGEWHCHEPRHWMCTHANALHQFMLVGGAVMVCRTCGKTEQWLSRQLEQRLNEGRIT